MSSLTPMPKGCLLCQAINNCPQCKLLRDGCYTPDNIAFLRQLFERENRAYASINALQHRQTQYQVDIQKMGNEIQRLRLEINNLKSENTCLRATLTETDQARTKAAYDLQQAKEDHRGLREAFHTALTATSRLAPFLSALSELPDEAEGMSRFFTPDDVIRASTAPQDLENLIEAVRRTVLRAKTETVSLAERLETFRTVIEVKDNRIEELNAKLEREGSELRKGNEKKLKLRKRPTIDVLTALTGGGGED